MRKLPAKLIALFVFSTLSLSTLPAPAEESSAEGWLDLFNGKDLDGWIPKITGHELGENYGNTFRVEDGLLKVRYDAYDRFDNQFGHLFWQTPHSHYHLIVEYRFVGDQLAGGAGWAVRNSGAMLHAQDPRTMTLTQDFPDSIEAQFLGGLSNDRPRPTANLCTPGTDVVYQGKLYTPHCLNSASATFDGDQWVRAELIVRGSERITHLINGEVVLEYTAPKLSQPTSHQKGSDAVPLLGEGYIALQSESHPVDFRLVRLKILEP